MAWHANRVYIPHSREQLDQPTITKRRSNQNIRLGDTTHLHLNTPQEEDAQRKGTKTQGGRIGHLAILGRPVQAWLELTPEGRHPALRGVDMGQGPIVTIVDMGAFGRLGMIQGEGVAAGVGVGGGALEVVTAGGFCRGGHVVLGSLSVSDTEKGEREREREREKKGV